MSDPRWQRLWQQFDALVDLTVVEREAKLAELGQQDELLASELSQLLSAHDEGTSPLDITPTTFDEHSEQTFLPGTKIGSWRLDSQVGQGGMGQVWRGYRDDGEFEQQVAIKFPTVANSELLRARFESERQTLARMNHPHIARLYDGGATESGQPYLVMEWIDGQTITDHCREFGARAKIEALLPICQAVDYSHRRLILHRDIKPGNILVTEDGNPKLVDFGIAKEISNFGESADQTQAALAFTPDYAAPEQIRGEAVGTPADVHALGAVLYELLTDEKPFRRIDKSLAEIIEDTARQSAVLPSHRVLQNSGRSRQLKGDLDRIVLKALHRDPERRYATAAGLASDLQNWLDGRPVSAQKDSASYRLRKFAARHIQGVVASALGLAALIALTIFLALQTERLRGALSDARAQAVRAQLVSNFLGDLFRQANPQNYGGKPPELRVLLEQGIEQIDMADLSPEISGSLKQTMGRTLVDLGEIKRGRETLLQALDELAADQLEQRAEALSSLAMTESMAENTDQAMAYQQQAMELLEQVGTDIQIRSGKAQLAVILRKTGDREQARALLEDALVGLSDSGNKTARVELAAARLSLGGVYWGDGDYGRAQRQYELAHKTMRSIFGDHHPRTANAQHALGLVHLTQGNYDEAEKYLLEALRHSTELLGEIHQQTASAHGSIGALYYQAGRVAEAREHHQAALRTEKLLFGVDSIRTSRSLNNLALVEHELGRFDDARELYDRATELTSREFGEDSERLIAPLVNLALLALDQNQPAEALTSLGRAATIAKNTVSADHPSRAFVAHLRGRALLALGRYEAAIEQLGLALSIRRKLGDERHPHTADTLIWLARAYRAAGQQSADKTVHLAEEAYQISLDKRSARDWRTLDYQITLGQMLRANGETLRGQQLETNGLQALIALRGAADWRVQKARENLALAK